MKKLNVFLEVEKKLNFYISVQNDTSEKYFWGFFVWIKTWCVYLLFEKNNRYYQIKKRRKLKNLSPRDFWDTRYFLIRVPVKNNMISYVPATILIWYDKKSQ
jgi:hypothetical protein